MSFKGRIFTQEHRDKLSKSHIGNTNAKKKDILRQRDIQNLYPDFKFEIIREGK